MKNMPILYFSIADIRIAIVLLPCKIAGLREELMHQIKTWLTGFMTTADGVIDYTITIKDAPRGGIFTKSGNKQYILLSTHNKQQIEAYYYMGFYALLRLLYTILNKDLGKNGGFFLHASAGVWKGKAICFVGPSGAGKSTILKLLAGTVKPLADDSIILKKSGNTFLLYQTPFVEKENWFKKNQQAYEVSSIWFLKQATTCQLKPVTDRINLIATLSKQLLVDREVETTKKQVKYFFEFLKGHKHVYHCYFNTRQGHVIQLLKNQPKVH